MLKIKVQKLYSGAVLPARSVEGDTAFDLFACLNRNETIRPGERRIIPCGIAVEMPEGYGLFIIPKSGLSVKHGVTVHNSPGFIDSNYRGEVRVVLGNSTWEAFQVFPGARVAQVVVLPVPYVLWDEVDELLDNKRETAYVHV